MNLNPVLDPSFFVKLDALLKDLAACLEAGAVWLVGLSPRGGFTLLRPRGIDTLLVKAYDKGLRHTDVASWSAVRDRKPAAMSVDKLPKERPDRQLWTDLDIAHLAAAPVEHLLWPGYAGAVVVARNDRKAPFNEAHLKQLAAGAQEVAQMYASRHQQIWRDPTETVVTRRAFVFGKEGWVDADPKDHGFSSGFAAAILKSTKARFKFVGKKPAIKLTNRDLLHDPVAGEYRPVRFGVAEHCAINPDLGPAVFVTLKPSISEWLAIEAEDFAAQPDIEQLVPAFRFIAQHYVDGTGIFRISEHVRLSPFHFHRKFTDVMGITPKHFMSECQLRLCKQLLLNPAHSLQDIARLCNFSHQSHFTSRFHQTTGHTPARWRKRALQLAKEVNGHLDISKIDARTGIVRLEEELMHKK